MPRSTPINIHIGSRIRRLREIRGWSQTKLGKSIGLTFQQIQKYENGVNKAGDKLVDLARVLEVPIAYFYDDMSPELLANLGFKNAADLVGPIAGGEYLTAAERVILETHRRLKTDKDREQFGRIVAAIVGPV